MTAPPADNAPETRRDRIRREVATWPPFTPDDLDAIAAVIAPGWVLEDTRAKSRRRKPKT